MSRDQKNKPAKPETKGRDGAGKVKDAGRKSGRNQDAAGSADTRSGRSSVFPVVGMAASAGGVRAFEEFFSSMPGDQDPGMAFVLVQHQSPDFKSHLSDIISRHTRMQVLEIEDEMEVRPDRVYILPSNRDLALMNGKFQLLDAVSPRGRRMPADFFFRSLAHDQGEQAIGVVLSGTGSDGTLGVRAIKAEGGMVMVQEGSSAEYDGMPRSSLATGLVDYELPPQGMPGQLMAYAQHAMGRLNRGGSVPEVTDENSLNKIFILLRTQTGHDFSEYKPSTIHRRIARRMAVHQIERLDNYVNYLQKTPAEVDALFRDMLIGVTSFFRDQEAFRVLEEQVIPKIFTGKSEDAIIRFWVPGCATGEEAYSLAILCAEEQARTGHERKVKIFTTDIDSRAIDAARSGLYPASIAADISTQRLKRFFSRETDGHAYRIKKNIREMLVFSRHDVLKDPPFSRLDLISCRNLLIYLGEKLQKRLIPLFHYALNPQGFLFLGTSESIAGFRDLFAVHDRKFKIYRRKNDTLNSHHLFQTRSLPPMISPNAAIPQTTANPERPWKLPLRELTEQSLLRQVAPCAALVNSQGDILYTHGRTGQYLELSPGEAGVNNILRMAREGLRLELTTALHKAVADQEVVIRPDLRVKTNGDSVTVNLTVRPVKSGLPDAENTSSSQSQVVLYLVVLDKKPLTAAIPPGRKPDAGDVPPQTDEGHDPDDRIASLQKELQARDEYIQSAFEELETSNEELSSSNEELHSTNEELETSKEELQSVNEELQASVAELSQANNDMHNLLASTGVGTLFVDTRLRIVRYTPAATRVVNLIEADTGRPLAHISTNLREYDNLVEDTRSVLDSLVPRELEVRTGSGEWYLMHIRPYRTLENTIEGAVITFVEITSRKETEEELRQAKIEQSRQQLFEDIVATVREPMLVLDRELRVMMASRAFYHVFRVSQEDTQGRLLYRLGNGQWDIPELRRVLEKILPRDEECSDFVVSHDFEHIGSRSIRLNARRIHNHGHRSELILLAMEDVTDTQAEQ